jgi:medium-chain acyl-[acyl-carrier-protein] hydrolase
VLTKRLPDPWFPYPRPNPSARLRLFCYPFAGGGASAFRHWPDGLPRFVEVVPVQPPGRETRFREPAFTLMAPLVTALADALQPHHDRPYAIFGHSLGALVAFELVRELRRRGGRPPARLIVSGHGAPHLLGRHTPMHALPDDQFRAELRRLNGTPAAVLDNDELMSVLTPTLRADMAVGETYTPAAEPPLDCPILALGGEGDAYAPPPDLEAWREHTRAACEVHVLPGEHFFLQTHRTPLLKLLTQYLESMQLS